MAPGGNDSLIRPGMPLLWPHARVAFLAMCLAVGIAQLAEGQLRTIDFSVHRAPRGTAGSKPGTAVTLTSTSGS